MSIDIVRKMSDGCSQNRRLFHVHVITTSGLETKGPDYETARWKHSPLANSHCAKSSNVPIAKNYFLVRQDVGFAVTVRNHSASLDEALVAAHFPDKQSLAALDRLPVDEYRSTAETGDVGCALLAKHDSFAVSSAYHLPS